VDDSGRWRPLWCKTLSLFTELSGPIAPVVEHQDLPERTPLHRTGYYSILR